MTSPHPMNDVPSARFRKQDDIIGLLEIPSHAKSVTQSDYVFDVAG